MLGGEEARRLESGITVVLSTRIFQKNWNRAKVQIVVDLRSSLWGLLQREIADEKQSPPERGQLSEARLMKGCPQFSFRPSRHLPVQR
jgi:hypothetical protein